MPRIPWFAPRHLTTPTGERLGVEIRAHVLLPRTTRVERRASRKVDPITVHVEDSSQFDRAVYVGGLQERAHAVQSLTGATVISQAEIESTFQSPELGNAVESASKWSGVGNLQFTPGGYGDTEKGRLTSRSTMELDGLQARRQKWGADWAKPEIRGDEFFAAVRGLIGDSDGVYAIMGPSADFTGKNIAGGKPGAGEIGVLTMVRKQGKRYTIYDGSILTTATHEEEGWSTRTTVLAQREHSDVFAINAPFDKAIIANLGVLRLDRNQDSESAPFIVRATLPAGKTVTLRELTGIFTGLTGKEEDTVQLPRGSMFVMAKSAQPESGFSVSRNIICAMPEELPQKEWLKAFEEEGYSAVAQDFSVSGNATYIAGGTFDTDLAYSMGGHLHGMNAESGGHLVNITAKDAPVEIAVVMYPSRKSNYTPTIPLMR